MQIILRNIIPTDIEMSSLQIPLVLDDPVPAPSQTSTHTRCQENDSDDDFQTCPQILRARKGKEKVVYHQPPKKKKLRSAGPVPSKKQTNVASKLPAKRITQRRSSVSPATRIPQTTRKSPARRPTTRPQRNWVDNKL